MGTTFDPSLSGCLDAAASAGGTPFYAASTAALVANIDAAVQVFATHDVSGRLAYSVKSNYLAAYIRASVTGGHLIEVVSANEFAYVHGLGVSASDIVVNGPGKSLELMTSAILAGATVNLDSLEEARELHTWVKSTHGSPLDIGVRVAARLADGRLSRFGVNVEDPAVAAELRDLCDGTFLRCVALHLHHSSRRDAESFADRVRTLASAANILGVNGLQRLDIGGGFASDPPPEIRARLSYRIDPIEDCVAAAVGALKDAFPDSEKRPSLVIEPGLGVLADTMDYVCRVVAIKRLDDKWAIITDGSMFEVNPFRGVAPPATPVPSSGPLVDGPSGPATLYGSTCMEIDQLGHLDDAEGVAVGDFIVIRNVGAYALPLTPEFIFQRAAVVCAETGELLRERQQLGYFAGGGS